MIKSIKNKKIAGLMLIFIKPFIIPIICITTILIFTFSITDILYIAFNNEEKIDINKELSYYQVKYERNEMQDFFSSVWKFVQNIFGNIILGQTEWPVKRTLYNNKQIWRKRSPN